MKPWRGRESGVEVAVAVDVEDDDEDDGDGGEGRQGRDMSVGIGVEKETIEINYFVLELLEQRVLIGRKQESVDF